MKTKHLLLTFFFAVIGFSTSVIAQTNISTAAISEFDENYLYSGYGVTPTPKLTNDTTLIKEVDYTLSYSNNIELGVATLTISGIGSYNGSVSRSFNIVEASQSLGYYLWDSNGDITSTLDTLYLEEGSQIAHIQIKFDSQIQIVDQENLRSQFAITYAGSIPENANRTVSFAVDPVHPSILEITIPSKDKAATAQASSTLSIKASNPAGWIPAITDADGNAVNLIAIQSIQPTGMTLEEVSSTVGTSSVPASITYRLSAIPLVRSMNFLQARSNIKVSEVDPINLEGYIGKSYYTVHSHSFFSMLAKNYVTSLLSTANITTFDGAGYTLESVAIEEDEANPQVKLTAKTATEGEVLSWVVYHYPYRNAADRKFELSQIIDTISTANTSLIDAANIVLYDIKATEKGVANAIASLKATASNIDESMYDAKLLDVVSVNNTIVVKGAKEGCNISIYTISGLLIATKSASTDIETFVINNPGMYIVKSGEYTSKVIVK